MRLPLQIHPQPNDHTCGPTSLHAVYGYWEHELPLHEVISEAPRLEEGGTLAVLLGIDALQRGYEACIYSFNLHLFDPTWASLNTGELKEKLAAQARLKKQNRKLVQATRAYLTYLELGGTVRFDPLDTTLLRRYLNRNIPILAGLSATYLYRSAREYSDESLVSTFDDLRGEPMGHFVVLCGTEGRFIHVADPWKENPFSNDHFYLVDAQTLINAVHLGIVTYDANLLIVTPHTGQDRS